MKICQGNDFVVIRQKKVFVDGVKVWHIDMAKGIIIVLEPVKLVELNFPKGITIAPINKEYNEKRKKVKQKIIKLVATVYDRHDLRKKPRKGK